MWTPEEETVMTVGELREAMKDLPDDAEMFVDGNPDRPIVHAMPTQMIPHARTGWVDNGDEWHVGDPTITGLELWLGSDEHFPAPRCNHSTRPKEDKA